MSLVKKILGFGSIVVLGGILVYSLAREGAISARYMEADSKPYRLSREDFDSWSEFDAYAFRTEFPILHDTNHDGTPDATQVIVAVFGGGSPLCAGTGYTLETRKPTDEEILWFQSQK